MEPKIRLKGFCGEWKSTPFLETFDYIKNNSLSRDMLSQEGEVQNIHYGDVLIKYGECVDSNIDDIPFVKDDETAKVLLRTGALQNGDVIIADAAEDNSVGKCAEIVCDSTAQMVSGLHTIPVRPKSEFASRYLGYYMNSPAYHNQLLPHIQGTKISSISKKAVACTNIIYPASKDEQRALATFFTSLDNQISAAEKRLASLKQVKAASLQAMFPQEGETTPKLRFKGCEGEWEKVKLGEVFEFRNGYTPSKAVNKFWTNGTIPWFRMEDIRDKGGILKDAYQKITPEAVKGGGLFEANSILLATTATIGVHAMLIADSLANQQFTNLSIRKSLTNNYFPMFVYYAFFGIDEWCIKNTNTGGLLSVNINELCKLPFLTPSLSEQRQIASYFTSLDHQISAQSSKISKLRQIKSACLDQMFV